MVRVLLFYRRRAVAAEVNDLLKFPSPYADLSSDMGRQRTSTEDRRRNQLQKIYTKKKKKKRYIQNSNYFKVFRLL